MPNLEALSVVCSLLEISGFFFIIGWKWLPRFTGLISVCGFAGVVKVFLPLAGHQSIAGVVAAICGVGIIVYGAVKPQTT